MKLLPVGLLASNAALFVLVAFKCCSGDDLFWALFAWSASVFGAAMIGFEAGEKAL